MDGSRAAPLYVAVFQNVCLPRDCPEQMLGTRLLPACIVLGWDVVVVTVGPRRYVHAHI